MVFPTPRMPPGTITFGKHAPLAEDEAAIPDLEDAQLEQVLAVLDNRKRWRRAWRPIVEFARETGMRKGELGRLRREDVGDGFAVLVSTRARGRTKSRRRRVVPLSRRAMEILEEVPRRPDGFVFGRVGDPRRAFAAAAKEAGLGRIWLHLFRHVAASRLADAGAGVHDLQGFGGWSSPRMAARYTHASVRRIKGLLDSQERARAVRASMTKPPPAMLSVDDDPEIT